MLAIVRHVRLSVTAAALLTTVPEGVKYSAISRDTVGVSSYPR